VRTQLTILRPGIIYGAFSETWTVRFARRIMHYRWQGFGSAGEGFCNLIYARDLAHAVLAAAEVRGPPHVLILNINGPAVVTWNEYVRRFGDELGVADRMTPNALAFNATILGAAATRTAGRFAKSVLGDLIMKLYLSPRTSGQIMQGAGTLTKLYPEPEEARLWRRQATYTWERAEQEIGFRAATPLDEGLRQSAAWCHLHGVTP
jgi:nucleoside-diphosphate-sugar epimerase